MDQTYLLYRHQLELARAALSLAPEVKGAHYLLAEAFAQLMEEDRARRAAKDVARRRSEA